MYRRRATCTALSQTHKPRPAQAPSEYFSTVEKLRSIDPGGQTNFSCVHTAQVQPVSRPQFIWWLPICAYNLGGWYVYAFVCVHVPFDAAANKWSNNGKLTTRTARRWFDAHFMVWRNVRCQRFQKLFDFPISHIYSDIGRFALVHVSFVCNKSKNFPNFILNTQRTTYFISLID